MPTYQYRCRDCRAIHERVLHHTDPRRNDLPHCANCGTLMMRKFSFSPSPSFDAYFDIGIGKYVTSRADLDAKCRQQSEANEARTGIPSNIVAYDRRDITPADLGVTDDGMDATHDRAVEEGRIDPTGKITF